MVCIWTRTVPLCRSEKRSVVLLRSASVRATNSCSRWLSNDERLTRSKRARNQREQGFSPIGGSRQMRYDMPARRNASVRKLWSKT